MNRELRLKLYNKIVDSPTKVQTQTPTPLMENHHTSTFDKCKQDKKKRKKTKCLP
jgi:hypothetical protein